MLQNLSYLGGDVLVGHPNKIVHLRKFPLLTHTKVLHSRFISLDPLAENDSQLKPWNRRLDCRLGVGSRPQDQSFPKGRGGGNWAKAKGSVSGGSNLINAFLLYSWSFLYSYLTPWAWFGSRREVRTNTYLMDYCSVASRTPAHRDDLLWTIWRVWDMLFSKWSITWSNCKWL